MCASKEELALQSSTRLCNGSSFGWSLSRLLSLPSSSWGRTMSWRTHCPVPTRWEVFQDLCKKWPVMISLFATSLNHRCSLYFFALPRSEGSGDRFSSSELGRPSVICLSTLVPDSAGSEETSFVFQSPHDSGGGFLTFWIW